MWNCYLLSDSLSTPPKTDSLQKILRDIFISPVDAFDSFLNGGILSRVNLFFFHFIMWLYAPIMKLSLNGFLYLLHEEASETPKPNLIDGLFLSFLVYPFLFSIGIILDIFRKYYKKFEFFKDEPTQGIWILSFVPVSSSFVFWILPKPFNAIGVIISFFFSLKLYYSALLNLDNFKKVDFIRLIFYFLTTMGIFTFFLILIGNFIRTKI
jgi:hypothetical protein